MSDTNTNTNTDTNTNTNTDTDTNTNKDKSILYLSIDVETDGPTPMLNNLLSIGIAGITIDQEILYTFEANVLPLPNHNPDKNTMENFWLKSKQRKAWNYLLTNQRHYVNVFEQLSCELKELSNKHDLIFIANPACFDWMFLKCYYEQAKINSDNQNFYDIGFKCVCISTLTNYFKKLHKFNPGLCSGINKNIRDNTDGILHTALYDATVQGLFYCNLLFLIS